MPWPRSAARSSRREHTNWVDLEVALSGEDKDAIVRELERMSRQLATQGIRLRSLGPQDPEHTAWVNHAGRARNAAR